MPWITHERASFVQPHLWGQGRARSVVLTETGLCEAEAAFRRLFESDDQATRGADAVAAASSEASRR